MTAPFSDTETEKQLALLSQRVEILISTVEQEFRGFRQDVTAMTIRQNEGEKVLAIQESRLATGMKRLDEFYSSYDIDCHKRDESVGALRKEVNEVNVKIVQLSKDMALLTKVIGTVGVIIGGWIINQILGIIK